MAAAVTRDFPIGPFFDAATRWLAAGEDSPVRRDIAEPMPAATVLLVRGEPVEVFMVERAGPARTDPPTWVFPGGRIDATDAGVAPSAMRWAEGGPDEWSEALGVEESMALRVLVCALRELFAVAGVLLASSDGERALEAFDDASLQRQRAALASRHLTFAEVVGDLELRADLLAGVDRWITPEFESRRYDTWFVTAALPDGDGARVAPADGRASRWVRPEDMMGEAAAGRVSLLPPTVTALERLSRAQGATEALRQAETSTFGATRPRVLLGPDGPYLQAEVNL